jgi:ActR/RegA family two-component response regulator
METTGESPIDDSTGEDRSLQIVDDDRPFRERLSKAMARRGFDVRMADSIKESMRAIRQAPPEYPISADRVRWEHIQRVYERCDRNVSETAPRDE